MRFSGERVVRRRKEVKERRRERRGDLIDGGRREHKPRSLHCTALKYVATRQRKGRASQPRGSRGGMLGQE
jgi:hypothetical protein